MKKILFAILALIILGVSITAIIRKPNDSSQAPTPNSESKTSSSETTEVTVKEKTLEESLDTSSQTSSKSSPRDPKQKPKYPTAKPVPGKPGFVFSPDNNSMVDVRGLPPGTLVKDPESDPERKEYFRVPEPAASE